MAQGELITDITRFYATSGEAWGKAKLPEAWAPSLNIFLLFNDREKSHWQNDHLLAGLMTLIGKYTKQAHYKYKGLRDTQTLL